MNNSQRRKNILPLIMGFLGASTLIGTGIAIAISYTNTGQDVISYNVDGSNWGTNVNGELQQGRDWTINNNKVSYSHDQYQPWSYVVTNATIPGKVIYNNKEYPTVIADHAFYACPGLNGNLTISSDIETIGIEAFSGCFNLTGTLTINGSTIEILNNAFLNCSYVSDIVANFTSQPAIGVDAFSGWKQSGGTVKNTGIGYSSNALLAFLKTKGLPGAWTVAS